MRSALIATLGFFLTACQGPGGTVSAPPPVAAPVFKNAQDEDRQLVAMLKARQYARLDETLQAIQRAYETDPLAEQVADVAWAAFSRTGAGFGPLLDEWVRQTPRSYAARLARGCYLMNMGGAARGGRFAAETKAEQFQGMAQYHAKALQDLDAASSANPRALHALVYRMEIAKAGGGQQELARQLYEQALKLNPLSYTARDWYLEALLPRWGGSYESMDAVVAAARPYYEKNPRLKMLEGATLSDRTLVAIRAQNYLVATALATKALEFGERPDALRLRAETYVRRNQFAPAMQDLDKALAAQPVGWRTHYLRGFIQVRQRNMAAAIDEFTAELELNHTDHKTLDSRGAVHASMGDVKTGLADFEKALALDPQSSEYRDDVEKARQFLGQGR